MKSALITFGKVLVSLVLAIGIIAAHAATLESWSIAGNLFFVLLFSLAVFRILWGRTTKKSKHKLVRIDPKTWEDDFRDILASEGFSTAEATKAIKFADNFRRIEKRRYELAKELGFKGAMESYESNWEKVFGNVMDLGGIALAMKPKTMNFLHSLRIHNA